MELRRKSIKALRLAKSPLWRRGLAQGVAATIEHDALPLRHDYASVIDVGANRGQFALYARDRFAEATVLCFEPLSAPRERIELLFQGDSRVEIYPYAAGATRSRAPINVSHSDDSSSLLEISALQVETFPGTQRDKVEEIEVVQLDDYVDHIERPALLKVDVQGYELEVLKGASKTLDLVDDVLIECSFVPFYVGQPLFDNIYAYLTQRGFALRGGHMTSFRDQAWLQGDFVFRRAIEAQHEARQAA